MKIFNCPTSTSTRYPEAAFIDGVHDFPGPYTFKVFGTHATEFVDAVREAAEDTAGASSRVELSVRPSAKGNYACITVTAHLDSAQHVQALYVAFDELPLVRMVL